MKPRVIIICNALDDVTRQQRGITTDSPAASRKVFMLCKALRLAGVRPCIVSLGRGRAGGSNDFFPGVLQRVEGVPIFYLPFSRKRLLSELISLIAPLGIIFKLRRQKPNAIIFYNRMMAYIPSLLVSSLLGYKNILDLEDGELTTSVQKIPGVLSRIFDRFCKGGALLACNGLADQTSLEPVLTYYGTAVSEKTLSKWQSREVMVLMSGTLSKETGAELLIDTIRQLRRVTEPWAAQLCFHVTGFGPSLEGFKLLASEPGSPRVNLYGRTTDMQYHDVLRNCDVGLALKLNDGPLANTTFPSKVIEFAAAGLLVLTTDISDVREVLGSSAYYLLHDKPEDLMGLFERIVNNQQMAKICAQHGSSKVQKLCAPISSGKRVANFIFGAT